MKLVRDAKTLKLKAISSLRTAMVAFNSYDDEGRVTSILLHLQHACEMLLKAVLLQNRRKVFDKDTGKSLGFEKCLNLCQAHYALSASEAGVMRTMDALRDAAQHWFVFVSEDILYMQTRALITAFDEYLKRALQDDLQSHIPPRVLPVSTKAPGDFEFLVDKEFTLIADLLRPGKRHRDEARARIRSLIAMEAMVAEEVEISERDIDRIEKAIKAGQEISKVFPRLITISTSAVGEGTSLKIHFSKKEGAPVRYVGGDDPEEAATLREVDLRKKFHMRATELANALGLTTRRSKVLRTHLGIDADTNCCHVFEFGKLRIPCFSDNARNKMKEALEGGLNLDELLHPAVEKGRGRPPPK